MFEAEKSVIGCILIESSLFDKAATRLSGQMFADQIYGDAFRAMAQLRKQNHPIDFVTVLSKLNDAYKAPLYYAAESVLLLSSFDAYVGAVLDSWRERTLCTEFQKLAISNMTADDLTAEAEKLVQQQKKILEHIHSTTERTFFEAAYEAIVNLSKPDTALHAEWQGFDRTVGGLQRGGLYVIAARPGCGKTDFSVQLAVQLAKRYHVRYQSMEMTVDQITQRILSRVCQINSEKFRNKTLCPNEQMQVVEVGNKMQELRLIIDEAAALNVETVRAKIAQSKPDAVFLDYLGLMQATDRKGRAGWEMTKEVTGGLKTLAKETNTVIIAMVQLNRTTDKQSGKPTLSDLYGGSAVESDADGVLFMWPDKDDRPLSGDDFRPVTVIVAKNRHGMTCDLSYNWQPQYHRYTEVTTRYDG